MRPAKEDGQSAITRYAIVDQAGQRAAWLTLNPLTGRTHQLRVHCTVLGTPIVGDGKYGGKEAFIAGLSNKLHLHARSVTFPHPITGARMDHRRANGYCRAVGRPLRRKLGNARFYG
jgi:23S rRNA pseudouridine955/2504/2580 synthase